MVEVEKYKLIYFNDGDIGFYIDSKNPPMSLIKKLNDILFNMMVLEPFVIIEESRVVFNKGYTHILNRILPCVGYSQSIEGILIWDKELDPLEIECRKPHIIKI